MKGHVALLLVLLLSGCASARLLPIEVSSRTNLWALAHPPLPEDLTSPIGDLHKPELLKLKSWALSHGYDIAYGDLDSLGFVGLIYNSHVTLDESLSPNAQLNVLLHELAHDLIPFEGTNHQREAVAETVAYMVAQRLLWNTPESLTYLSGIPVETRSIFAMRYEKEILKVVDLLTHACKD